MSNNKPKFEFKVKTSPHWEKAVNALINNPTDYVWFTEKGRAISFSVDNENAIDIKLRADGTWSID